MELRTNVPTVMGQLSEDCLIFSQNRSIRLSIENNFFMIENNLFEYRTFILYHNNSIHLGHNDNDILNWKKYKYRKQYFIMNINYFYYKLF